MSEFGTIPPGYHLATRDEMSEILDRTDFFYVYRVTGRKDGLEYSFQDTARISAGTLASFRDAVDAQRWVDALRAAGERVEIMPSANGIIT